ncbi:polysaccharide biosynthesis protein [Alcanivorax sp. DSM 26295]|jgi:FlaA1/EpsC-like NDP-sugar epimerase|uniref:polysaccharide biosynthesis protein n=1 Tax=Alloalcanivorax venustensis TaxID=172371 RepID=UPI001171981F|nr:polysaccharide biosynthesis protein [Alcanivorax sp.]SMO56553.1 NDP-sugar epimerase, includes UDP-GlcNAc-inverting 4,6-dehydratase FlaA1 and capsular polysaccharide biosynthesis protein EpsC [Alcanivorax sp. DSM 26295]|tara:strand:+ start:1758 stop:3725 length:1968 start_codon:yes stop_codon:yes gene_type:complete
MALSAMQRSVSRVLQCSRWQKRGIMMITDALILPLLLWGAYALRFSTLQPVVHDTWLFPIAALTSVAMLYVCGFYRSILRYLGSEAAWSIVTGMAASVITLAAMSYMVPAEVPRSIFVIYWLLGTMYLGASRFLARRFLFRVMAGYLNRERVAVFGAGEAGAQLVAALQSGRELNPVLVVDDDPGKQGSLLCGVPVVNRQGLQAKAKQGAISTVLLALPTLPRHRRMALVNWLEQLDIRVQTVPTFNDIASGRARLDEIQDVAIEDLLGRDTVPPRLDLLSRCISGKHVLVTGAGGSIGSELCRQIVKLAPARLVLLEQSEVALYDIERELRGLIELSGRDTTLVPMLGSVVNRGHVQRLCRENRIDTLYHAAAYKHVPIVEANPAAGVRNNIIGTLAAAEGAEAAGVKHFILVSTDKAVRPTNVMGATKRFAEMVLQTMAARGSETVFSIVRFGNVLGSSGSVVPLFRDQIRQGGPVTVTHPEVVRYFMTIPEASQLVIQAGAMAKGGEVFVLDMGEPVRILDLAQTMIRLMGLSVRDESNPEGDIEIVFSGLRPGEKLFEELLIGDASVRTEHEMIMQAHEETLSDSDVVTAMEAFRAALDRGQSEPLKALLRSYVNGYQPRQEDGEAPAARGGVEPVDTVIDPQVASGKGVH